MAKKNENLSLEELLEQAIVKDEDRPYEVPGNWICFYFTSLIDIQGGTQPPKSQFTSEEKEGFVRLVQIRDFASDDYKVYIPAKNNLRYFSEEDILIARYGASIGRICTGLSGACNVALAKTTFSKRIFHNRFMYWLLNSEYFQNPLQFISRTAQAGFNKEDLGEIPMILPPLPEQQRIVDVIETLFEKLDHAKELAQNALDSFENRNSAILHKAFTGELTAKWREENGAKISKDYLCIIKDQRLKFARGLKEINEITEIFDSFNILENSMPNGWLRLPTMMFCDKITCGKTPSDKLSISGEIPFLKVYNIVDDKIDFKYKPQFIDMETHNGKLQSSRLLPNDVVMNIVGPPLRKIAIIPNDFEEWNMNQAIVRFRPVEYVSSKYLYYCLLYKETLEGVISETKGVVGQANISVSQSRNLRIPIPCKSEQKEIVRILDNILETEQKAKELYDIIEKIDLMKKAILARAFRGELGTNNPEEESALKLLKEVLKEKL